MAYCPRCNREQRCGCEKCHICGGELVERRGAPSGRPAQSAGINGEPRPGQLAHESHADRSEDYNHEKRHFGMEGDGPTAPVLPALLLVLGSAILLITLLEAINSALNFPNVGAVTTVGDGLKRVGYYLGNLLYTNSVRTLVGFALVSAGLLLTPKGPIADSELVRRIRQAVGLVMGVIGAICVLAALLLVLPLGTTTLLLKNLLPSVWVAVCIILVMGAGLLYGGYLISLYDGYGGRYKSVLGRKLMEGTPGSRDREGGRLARKGGKADRHDRGTYDGSEKGLEGTRRGVVNSYSDKGSGAEGDME